MKDNPRWMELARLASEEKDPVKMLALVKEINDLLEAKQRRLTDAAKPTELEP
ncbi:MAG: hypothetical protein WAL32_06280 [Terriglobales bacterium]